MTFGQRLRLTLDDRKRGNREIAKKIGYHETSIYKWCNDEAEPTLTAIRLLCKELKCSSDWLIFGKR